MIWDADDDYYGDDGDGADDDYDFCHSCTTWYERRISPLVEGVVSKTRFVADDEVTY